MPPIISGGELWIIMGMNPMSNDGISWERISFCLVRDFKCLSNFN